MPSRGRLTAQETVIALLRTADLVRRQTARVVEPHGITLQQYNVLRILQGAGEDGMPTLEVANRMIEQTPGVTRLMDRLEAKHLIRRQRCLKDRRQHLCWITPEGTKLLQRLAPSIAAAHDETLKGLESISRERLTALLERLRTPHE
jgi:MarR family transcriptional regulator, organic hydroperoxide resistance regulator